jgi:hypothetical protein
MKLDIIGVAQAESGHTIVGSDYLMINAALENGDAAEHKMPFGRIPYIAGIVAIENVLFLLPGIKMQPSRAKPQRTAKTAALPTASRT